jgi:hypothetical protein
MHYPALKFPSDTAAEVRAKIILHATQTETGCWVLPFSTTHGYGNLSLGYKVLRAHRASYAAFVAPINEGQVIIHRCDNRACCNPLHILAGTQSQNIADCHAKGRSWHKRNPEVASMVGRMHALRQHRNKTDNQIPRDVSAKEAA